MQDWSIPLAMAAAAFFSLVVWRVRPVLPWGRRAVGARQALRTAKARIAGAVDERARARALCDAADVMSKRVAGRASATGLYLRAMRADPASVEMVERARAGLNRRPRALESLMWRHLASSPWGGPMAPAKRAALDTLRALYEGPLRSATRARALANARDAIG